MNRKSHPSLILVIAAALIVTAGGCISLNPENLVPKSITPAAQDQHYDGTVNVQAFAPMISRGKVNFSFVGAASGRVRVAVEQALVRKGLFRMIEQGAADYVLDVWITDAVRELKTLGEGYVIDMTVIWRLTRTRDGKVVICDFANGHGAARAVGSNAFVLAMEAAVRDMIQKGLSALANRSTPLAALYIVEDWSSMGPVVPEGYKKMKDNLTKLRPGLTEDEVLKMIPSMANADRRESGQFVIYKSPVYDQRIVNNAVQEVSVAFFPFRNLVFTNKQLVQWELNK